MRMALGAAPDPAAQAELTRRFEDFEQAKSDAEAAARKKERDEEKADLDHVRDEALARIRQAEQAANEKAGRPARPRARRSKTGGTGRPRKSSA